jgi:hypothetical protein
MTSVTTKPEPSQPRSETAVQPFDNWLDASEVWRTVHILVRVSRHEGARPL